MVLVLLSSAVGGPARVWQRHQSGAMDRRTSGKHQSSGPGRRPALRRVSPAEQAQSAHGSGLQGPSPRGDGQNRGPRQHTLRETGSVRKVPQRHAVGVGVQTRAKPARAGRTLLEKEKTAQGAGRAGLSTQVGLRAQGLVQVNAEAPPGGQRPPHHCPRPPPPGGLRPLNSDSVEPRTLGAALLLCC